MLNVSSELLQSWVLGLMIPLTRILGFISIAPIFGHRAVPKRVKLGLGIMLALIISPTLPEIPKTDLISLQGVFMMVEQIVIGLSIGFMVSIIFSGIEMAGQISGMTMGLGFASFFDPQSRGSTIVLGQFFGVLAMLVFLSIDGHLMMVSAMMDSFQSFPIGMKDQFIDGMKVARWGSQIFSIGLQLSLPVIATLLITNLALGVLTRTAPQLNLFGIGFPITMGAGFIVIALTLPSMAAPIQQYIEDGIASVSAITSQ